MRTTAPRSEAAVGLAYGFAAYLWWALVFPLHLRLLNTIAPTAVTVDRTRWALEILGHRVVWSLVLCLLLVPMRRRVPELLLVLRSRSTALVLLVTATLISVNWLVFIYALSTGQLYRAGIGYFVTPMVQIALGTVFLHERLRVAQWVGVCCAGVGIAVLVAVSGTLPWIELSLALSFGFYGLLRKRARVGPIVGMSVETAWLAPLAIGWLLWSGAHDSASSGFLTGGPTVVALLVLTGASTALPLIWFAGAAVRLPLVTIGFLQFVAPSGQFLLGVVAFGERPADPRAWLGYAAIWSGVVVVSLDAVRTARARRATL